MMPKKGKCCRCKKYGKIYWANYNPYCMSCLDKKSKNAIPFEDAMFPELKIEKAIGKVNKRLDKLEKEVKKLNNSN